MGALIPTDDASTTRALPCVRRPVLPRPPGEFSSCPPSCSVGRECVQPIPVWSKRANRAATVGSCLITSWHPPSELLSGKPPNARLPAPPPSMNSKRVHPWAESREPGKWGTHLHFIPFSSCMHTTTTTANICLALAVVHCLVHAHMPSHRPSTAPDLRSACPGPRPGAGVMKTCSHPGLLLACSSCPDSGLSVIFYFQGLLLNPMHILSIITVIIVPANDLAPVLPRVWVDDGGQLFYHRFEVEQISNYLLP